MDLPVFFPFQRPELAPPEQWLPLLEGAYATHRFSNHGPLALQLEAELTARVGRPVVLAANGTAAITAALMALGRSGAVILPSFTFPATLGAVLQAGLQPVLADVNAQTWELDVPSVEAALQACDMPIAAVLGVRTFGLCRDWTAVQEWCDMQGVPLVLDSAAALGGTLVTGAAAGSQARMETFSLHATKVFAVGEGGAIACEAQDVALLKRVMNFGLQDGNLAGWGFNGKLSELTAAVGIAQNRNLDLHLTARRTAARAYADWMRQDAAAWRAASDPGDSPWQAWPMLAPTAELADRFEKAAADLQVQTRRYYRPALHTCDSAHAYAFGQALPTATALASRMVCLPMYSRWQQGELDALLARLHDAMKSVNA